MSAATEREVGRFYDRQGGYLGEATAWYNQGYWAADPPDQDAASEALADLVGRLAGLGPGQRVLDVGFGFGVQDVFWLQRFGPASIVGINVSRRQTALAARGVAATGLAGRIRLHLGSATRMPFRDASFDRVVALESAHHFDPRDAFFSEARRVLRPGGRLALADITPMAPGDGALGRLAHAGFGGNPLMMPRANLYGRETYASRLRGAGFTGVRVVSIREHVWAPQARYLARRVQEGGDLSALAAMASAGGVGPQGAALFRSGTAWLERWLARPRTAARVVEAAESGVLDYVVAVGERPAGRPR